MTENRIIELEIKLAYQEDLIQALNVVVAKQQKQLGKLEETCKVLNEKIKSLALAKQDVEIVAERPPHY
ncbi:MAG: SlyX family protein [Methylomonas sp.]|nr:SlyX family protein [Methylomonas sp.]PPD21868.1 MAG: SlyX protein [Methylomonas sp.]PPD27513.1 MAG: SlyX protein [Methylomonas sp.]PPD39495.1 MAG: SlyX protein [Methylomonas sp.]PPD42326.1 MAG: SlyX protein [Methylomonas sp.]